MTPELFDDLFIDLGSRPSSILARAPDALKAHVVQSRGSRMGDRIAKEVDGLVDARRHIDGRVVLGYQDLVRVSLIVLADMGRDFQHIAKAYLMALCDGQVQA